MSKRPILDVVDPSGLTDADWAEINKIRDAYASGGINALSRAMDDLAASDAARFVIVMGAFFPKEVSETIKDRMAAIGLTDEDLEEMLRKAESGSDSKQ